MIWTQGTLDFLEDMYIYCPYKINLNLTDKIYCMTELSCINVEGKLHIFDAFAFGCITTYYFIIPHLLDICS